MFLRAIMQGRNTDRVFRYVFIGEKVEAAIIAHMPTHVVILTAIQFSTCDISECCADP